MANITRIKAKDDKASSKKETKKSDEPAEITRKVTVKAKNSENKKTKKADSETAKKLNKAEKKAAARKDEKPLKECFFLFIPFIALGRYIRDSFSELRQVRWPNRKETWKLVFAVILYVVIIAGFIMLLDMLFNFLFSKIYGGNK
jgi:preprotein translocase SecE subunit